jgi:hypothetical protein
MDGTQFDHMIREFTRSRRSLLGGGLAAVTGRLVGPAVEARKHRKGEKRKGKKVRPNEFGCLELGNPCGSAADCCSGICEGKKGKRRCGAHDTGGCVAGSTSISCGGADVACIAAPGEAGLCATTTGNAGYCRSAFYDYPCQTDFDCQTVNGGRLGPRAACIRCAVAVGGSICVTVTGVPS